VTWVKWKLVSIRLTQDRCTPCADHTVGLEIFLVALVALLGDMDQVEIRFGPFGDSVNLDAR
jgi:hypothetical protein